MKRVIVSLLAGVLVVLSISLISDNNTETGVVQTTEKKVTYKLEKFNQSCCVGIVEYTLKEVNGYIKSEANVEESQITIWFDSSKCGEQDLKDALNRTPYKVLKSIK